jgi:hypothetical protein
VHRPAALRVAHHPGQVPHAQVHVHGVAEQVDFVSKILFQEVTL